MYRPSRLRPTDLDKLVRFVVAAAASLPERAGAPWLCPVATPSLVTRQRLELWQQRSAGGDEAAFQAVCRSRPIDEPRAWVQEVAVPPGVAVPQWALRLQAFLAQAAAGTTGPDREVVERCSDGGLVLSPGVVPVPVRGGADALVPAVSLLRRELGRLGAASSRLVGDLLAGLAERLLARLGGLLLEGELPEGPHVAAAWGQLLGAYPAVGRCVGSLLDGYIGYATELCTRLDADAASLTSLVAAPIGTEVRAISCRPGAGDLHAGARSVTVVELEGARGHLYRAVYKPRDLAHVAVLAKVVRAAGLDLRLPACLVRKGYGWEAFIEPAPASTPEELVGAARELGAWALVFHVLGSSDLLAENVRICGSRVVPIDVEAMFGFRFFDASNFHRSSATHPGLDTSGRHWQPPGSAAALFSAPILRGEGRAPDAGLLAGQGRPLLAKADYVVAGYADAAASAGRQNHAVAPALAGSAGAPVRAIVRNTRTYENLLHKSLQPAALVDGVARDLVLETLWAAHLHGQCPASIIEAEIDALRRLDIPVFTFAPGTRQVSALGPPGTGEWGERTRSLTLLLEAPLSRAAERVASLGPTAEPAELDALRAAMFCAAENRREKASGTGEYSNLDQARAPRRRTTLPAWDERAAAAAAECATWLREGGPKGTPLAAGLTYVANNDCVVLSSRRAFDLFSGNAGIAVALASLARRFGQPTVAEAAEASTAEAAEAGRSFVENFCAWLGRGAVRRALGWAYGGVPALAVLCASTGAAALAQRQCCEALAALELAPRPALEAVAATTSALRSATGASPGFAAPAADRAEQLLNTMKQYALGTPRFPSNLGLLVPSERALADWALGGAGEPARGGEVGYRRQAAAHHNVQCAGSGDRLVAAAICPAELEPMPTNALGRLSNTALVAEVEVCLVAARSCAVFLESAESAGYLLVARRDASGQWFGDSLAPDRFRLSAVWGALACAHVLAGLADPTGFSSIRLFEPVVDCCGQSPSPKTCSSNCN